MPTYHDFPKMSSLPASDLPSISHGSSELPDYGRLFGSRSGDLTPFAFADIQAFEELIRFAHENERLRQYLGPPALDMPPEELDHLYDMTVAIRALDLLDRTIHLHGLDFDEGALRASYLELERGLLDDKLPVEVWVPIALTPFAVDELRLDDRVRLQRIPAELQLARVPSSIFGSPVHECVLDAATHALVVSGRRVKNENRWTARGTTLVRDPPEEVTRFFGALRLATASETGWAQIFLRPLGWAHHFTAHLPPVESAGLARRYPPSWDDYGWLQKRHVVTEAELLDTTDLYLRLAAAPRQLRLALRRLNSAMLREDEEDAVVDLLVGLEAALGDRSPTEMTHKLSLRVAALTARTAGRDAATTFRLMKKIYTYRSAIVHGGNTENARVVRDETNGEVPLLPVATELVREVLVALLREPRWQVPADVDAELLLG